MLRFFVLVLLLLNGVYFAWSQGLVRAFGFAPVQQTEPQRLDRQVRPQALQLLTPTPQLSLAVATPPAASMPGECLQAGPFDEAQSARLRSALESAELPVGAWFLDPAQVPARWIVYMGKFTGAQVQAQKRAELVALNIKVEPLMNPSLQPGLSLGGFDTEEEADAALQALSQRGVRTAQVLQERTEQAGTVLRVPTADDALRTKFDSLKPVLAGKTLGPCR